MLYRLRNIKIIHGSRTIIDIAELSIEAGKIYSLTGPNGAGKTSLLKILAFLDKPTTGQIDFLNLPVVYSKKDLLHLRRRIVLLDQSPIMFSGSVVKNIEFGLKVRKIPKKERTIRVDQVLELVGMSHFKNYDARNLSGGETKRVALARALVLHPEVLLCDEPTANVDNENQEIILNVLSEMNKERTCSVIFSTHYLSQAQRLADHTLLLQHGCLSDLVSENIFKMEAVETQEGMLICQLNGQVSLKLPERLLPKGQGGGKLRINPGQIELNPAATIKTEGNTLHGHLTELRQDKEKVRITINVGLNLSMTLSLKQYLKKKPAIGDKVEVFIPHDSINCSRLAP